MRSDLGKLNEMFLNRGHEYCDNITTTTTIEDKLGTEDRRRGLSLDKQ